MRPMQIKPRIYRFFSSVLLFLALGITFHVSPKLVADETNKVFRAGAAVANISPWMGVEINGNMNRHWGTKLHDQLHARAIMLDDGKNKLAICVADSCMIYREIFDEAKKRIHEKTGLPMENILMSATHTHSAP